MKLITLVPFAVLPVCVRSACTVCPNDQDPPNTNVLMEELSTYNVSTCAELNDALVFQNLDDFACAQQQAFLGIGVCGCDPPEPTCTLCPNGDQHDASCDEVQLGLYFSQIAGANGVFGLPIPVDDDVCDGYRIEEPSFCGCEQVDDPCVYCVDGAAPGTYPDANKLSCNGTAATMPFVPSTSTLCTYLQAFNHQNCGCANGPAEPTGESCQVICPPETEINRTECKLADLEASSVIQADENICTLFVATTPGCCFDSVQDNGLTSGSKSALDAISMMFPMLFLSF